jgi:hypothetical protein
MNAMQKSLNHGASYDWSIPEAATLLYLMDHICAPQDRLRGSHAALKDTELFDRFRYARQLSKHFIRDDTRNKLFDKALPFLRQVIAILTYLLKFIALILYSKLSTVTKFLFSL